MSLKAFHIVFISASALFSTAFGIWLLSGVSGGGSGLRVLLAIAAFCAAAGLVVYGVRFLKKLRHVSFL